MLTISLGGFEFKLKLVLPFQVLTENRAADVFEMDHINLCGGVPERLFWQGNVREGPGAIDRQSMEIREGGL